MKEKRRNIRYLLDEEIEILSPRQSTGRSIDLGEKGIGLTVSESFDPETPVELKMLNGNIILDGTVRWCIPQGDSFRIGVEFDAEDLNILHKINALASSAG